MKKEIIKSFDLDAYKRGAKVKTRNGSEVRIICTDVKNQYYPIGALVKFDDGSEAYRSYTSEGRFLPYKSTITNDDLVIVEEVEEPEFWSDRETREVKGYYIDNSSEIIDTWYINKEYSWFATERQAKSARAMAMISQIMANDIENFGGVITDEEWKNSDLKKVIYRWNNNIYLTSTSHEYFFLAFHTEEQRDLFLEKYRDLVKDYLMID